MRMQTKSKFHFPLIAVLLISVTVSSLSAASLTWNNGQNNLAWDTTSTNWGGPTLWNNATPDSAIFGVTGAGTITLGTAITADAVTFNTSGYVLNGGANNLTATTLAGASDFTKIGTNTLTLSGVSSYSGILTVGNGFLQLNTGASLLSGGGLILQGGVGALGGSGYPFLGVTRGGTFYLRDNSAGNVVGSQTVTLNNGSLLWYPNSSGVYSETIPNLSLSGGFNSLAVAPNAGAATLQIGNLARASGATVEFRAAYNILGGDAQFRITNLNASAIANVNGILGGWAFAASASSAANYSSPARSFATWNGSTVTNAFPDKANGSTAGTATVTGAALSTGTATENWLANSGTDAQRTITSDKAINSLIEEADVKINSGATLTLNSGGLILRNNSFWMQTSSGATGFLTSGTNELYLQADGGGGDQAIKVIMKDGSAGAVTLRKSGVGLVKLEQNHTYTGGTVVNQGMLDLQTGGATACIRGDVTVNPGGVLQLSVQDALGYGAGTSVTNLNLNGGNLNVNTNANQTLGNATINMTGGSITGNASGNIDFFGGNSALNTFASPVSSTISGVKISPLRQGSTTFSVEDGAAAIDLDVSSVLASATTPDPVGAVLTKAGPGCMRLSAANTYTGGTAVSGGTLEMSGYNGLLNSANFTAVSSGILKLNGQNLFIAGHYATMGSSRVIMSDAATLLMDMNFESRFANVTLRNGATWTCNRSLTSYDALLANTELGAATVLVTNTSGTAAATMNGTGGIHLQGVQNFDVADVTASPATDLAVNMILAAQGAQGGAAGGINKKGGGTITLSAGNTYNGDTLISAGRLALSGSGSISNSSSITLNSYTAVLDVSAVTFTLGSNQTLGGIGTVVGTVNVAAGGAIAPGTNNAGNLTLSGLTFSGAATVNVSPGAATLIVTDASGLAASSGANSVTLNLGTNALVPGSYTLIDYTGGIQGTGFGAFQLGTTPGGFLSYKLTNNIANGSVDLLVVPVPFIIAPPASQAVLAGYTAGFNVIATAYAPLSYQWQKNGTNLADDAHVFGSTNASLTINNVSAADVAPYRVIVSNAFGSVTSSVASLTISSSPIVYLSGTDKDHTAPWQFIVSGGANAGILTNISVPSCWETMGFGNYQYGNKPGNTNAEVGQYTHTFTVPSAWGGQRVFLVFEGVFTDAAVTINGVSVGPIHQGGFYEFKYEVTPYVVFGASTNVLRVTVNKWSANSSVNNAERSGDFWTFGGIFRPVYLEPKPSSYIERIAANPQANGQISVDAYLGGITNSYTVRASVTDSNNLPLGGAFSAPVSVGASNVMLSASLPTPNPWSAESPTLYTLTVQLRDTNNLIVQTVTNLIGFRTIVFSNNLGFFVNGKKVVLRGINRHEVWPTAGRTTSRTLADLDLGMIKDMNFNAVRMSHYPPNKIFLDECDRLGLYVYDELTGWQQAYDNATAVRLVKELVVRDVNHPSIIAWCNGNEGGWNTTVDNNGAGATNVYAIWDPQNRKTLRPWTSFADIVDDHYPSYNTFISKLGTGKTAYQCTEILHGLYDGGAGASLQEYWDAMRTASNGMGIFFWVFADEGIIRIDLGGIMDVAAQNAPDGLVGPYREKEASYYTHKAIYNPVQIGTPNPATFTGTLAVSNRFDFTDLTNCTFIWQLGWLPNPADPINTFSTNALTGGFITALESGSFSGPSVPPQTSGLLALPAFPAGWTNYDALRFAATDPFGNNLYTWTWPLRSPAQIRDRILSSSSAGTPAISTGTSASEIIVTNGPRVFRFSKTTGVLNSLTVSNQSVSFTNGPSPVVGSWAVNSITNYSDGTNCFVGMNSLASATNAFLWTLRPDGWLKLSYQYWLSGSQNHMGITFDYPSNSVTAMNWLGQGPYRVYKNRLVGQEIFAHTKTFNYGWTGQSTNYTGARDQWAYPEFAGYHGQLFWATLQTTEQPITVVTPTTNLFFRVLTPPATDHSNLNPAYPSGAISFLHGISPMGEKFNPSGNQGPAAQANTATGLYTGELNLFFGAMPAIPAVPDGLAAVAGNATATLSWSVVAGATGYNVKRSTVSGGPYTIIASNQTSLTFTNTGLLNSTTYYFVVSSVNSNGESATSLQVSATPTAPSTRPTFSGISLAQTNLILSGSNGTEGMSYLVLVSTNLTVPRTNWSVLATNLFAPGGGFNFTNPVNPNSPQEFYQIKVP